MSNDPRNCQFDVMVCMGDELAHDDLITEYNEHFEGVMERIKNSSKLTDYEVESEDSLERLREELELRLELLEDVAQKLEDSQEGRGKGTSRTKKKKEFRKERFRQMYAKEEEASGPDAVKEGIIRATMVRFRKEVGKICERTAWSYLKD
ncbi:MAG: hypothetical protein JEZ10_06315 [Verrucomicrobia bacterium]|nr:hypothetical protein [Verrucomicrobiota bacterium]